MIEYYTGVPGSGKTYRAVSHAFDCFLDEKSKTYKKYKYFYTNINEFKFDAFNIDKEDVAFVLDMDSLIVSLTELRTLYLDKQPDSVLMIRAVELNLADALFIIDEAHNFFDINNAVLVWWLSYHRHLHQDIILITQNLSLIYRKYLSFGEFFYNAVSSSLRLRGSVFIYHQFTKYQLTKNSHTNTFKIKFNSAVYALYSSGANTQGKKVIQRFIFIAVFLFIVVVLFFKFYSSHLGHSSDSNSTKSNNSIPSNNISNNINSDFFTVVCVGFDCSYSGQTLSMLDLNKYQKEFNLYEIKSSSGSGGVVFHTYSRNDAFLKRVFNVTFDSSVSR
ncbi:MAG: zonular occludens toxin domain-containing protein [Thiovulaceae bacterium]|nr:zonular occludens toxin domain-containing protein [Sulfurimonadaceae bacterium]